MKGKSRGSYGFSLLLRILVWMAGMITLGIFCCLLGYMLLKGLPHLSWDLFSPTYTSENVSLFPALVNTVTITLFSLLLAVPVGILSAVYLVEYAKRETSWSRWWG